MSARASKSAQRLAAREGEHAADAGGAGRDGQGGVYHARAAEPKHVGQRRVADRASALGGGTGACWRRQRQRLVVLVARAQRPASDEPPGWVGVGGDRCLDGLALRRLHPKQPLPLAVGAPRLLHASAAAARAPLAQLRGRRHLGGATGHPLGASASNCSAGRTRRFLQASRPASHCRSSCHRRHRAPRAPGGAPCRESNAPVARARRAASELRQRRAGRRVALARLGAGGQSCQVGWAHLGRRAGASGSAGRGRREKLGCVRSLARARGKRAENRARFRWNRIKVQAYSSPRDAISCLVTCIQTASDGSRPPTLASLTQTRPILTPSLLFWLA